MHSYVRERIVSQADKYLDVDMFIYTDEQDKAVHSTRKKREHYTHKSCEKQNDRRSRIYFGQFVNCNFGAGDLHVTLTYSDTMLPASIEEAERHVRNYIKRLNYARTKAGLPPCKWIIVTEHNEDESTGKPTRIHHHVIMDGALDRDVVEALWSYGKGKNKQPMGFVNADRLQISEDGLCAIAEYLTKRRTHCKRWTSSHGLRKPECYRRDGRISQRKLAKLGRGEIDVSEIEREYHGYELCRNEYGYKATYSDISGWRVSLKFKRKAA